MYLGGGLNYLWKITGPDGENGETITTTYPADGEEPLTVNSINHRFKKYGYQYNIDLYIKNVEDESFNMDTPASTLYMTTALPSVSMKCTSEGVTDSKNNVKCVPSFIYNDITDSMDYEWTFYSVDGSSITKDGDAKSTGNEAVTFGYAGSGQKLITLKGTHASNMIGTVEAEQNITLASAGVLNAVSCFRPTDNLGNYTDDTKLVWRCEAEGYYNDKNNLEVPLPLTSYIWTIKENNQAVNGEFSWGTGDEQGKDKVYNNNPNVKTRVDCNQETNTCTAALIFTADKYGADYEVTLKGKQQDQDDAGKIHDLTADPFKYTTDMPKLTGITRETSETNPMESIFTPTYDTNIPNDKTLNYYWKIIGSDTNTPAATWIEKGADNKLYTGDNDTTERTLTHNFSKSGNYAIELKITSDNFSNGSSTPSEEEVEMPNATGNENTLNFELNQQIAGSYFQYSINRVTNQVRFFTDYEARVNGAPVPTIYVYTIKGPTYNEPNPETINTIVITEKEFETIAPRADASAVNNLRLLFNATYTVTLEVYNSDVYNNGSSSDSGKVEDATYKKLTFTSGGTGNDSNQFTTDNLNISKYQKNNIYNTWYQDFYAIINTQTDGIGIDKSLFSCEWDFSTTANQGIKLGTTIPLDQDTAPRQATYDCSKVVWVYAFDQGGSTDGYSQPASLRITGPMFNGNNSKYDQTFDITFKLKNLN